jgi:hypothetical protein
MRRHQVTFAVNALRTTLTITLHEEGEIGTERDTVLAFPIEQAVEFGRNVLMVCNHVNKGVGAADPNFTLNMN